MGGELRFLDQRSRISCKSLGDSDLLCFKLSSICRLTRSASNGFRGLDEAAALIAKRRGEGGKSFIINQRFGVLGKDDSLVAAVNAELQS